MLRSMYSGISGLKNFQTKLDVIGNNIANVNTTGYKSSRVTFTDTLQQTLSGASAPTDNVGGTNPKQIGLGSAVGSIDMIMTDGSVQSTGKNTDLCLSGNGFFIVNGPNGTFYTRDGAFEFDKEGNYVLPGSGLYVQGWMANENGNIDVGGGASSMGNIVIKAGKTLAAKSSANANYTNNIDASAPTIVSITGGEGGEVATGTATPENPITLTLADGSKVTVGEGTYSVGGDYHYSCTTSGSSVTATNQVIVEKLVLADGTEISPVDNQLGKTFIVSDTYKEDITEGDATAAAPLVVTLANGDTFSYSDGHLKVGETYKFTFGEAGQAVKVQDPSLVSVRMADGTTFGAVSAGKSYTVGERIEFEEATAANPGFKLAVTFEGEDTPRILENGTFEKGVPVVFVHATTGDVVQIPTAADSVKITLSDGTEIPLTKPFDADDKYTVGNTYKTDKAGRTLTASAGSGVKYKIAGVTDPQTGVIGTAYTVGEKATATLTAGSVTKRTDNEITVKVGTLSYTVDGVTIKPGAGGNVAVGDKLQFSEREITAEDSIKIYFADSPGTPYTPEVGKTYKVGESMTIGGHSGIVSQIETAAPINEISITDMVTEIESANNIKSVEYKQIPLKVESEQEVREITEEGIITNLAKSGLPIKEIQARQEITKMQTTGYNITASADNPVVLKLSDGNIFTETSGVYNRENSLPVATVLNVYDSVGNAHTIPIYFTKTKTDSISGNQWTISVANDGSGKTTIKEADGSITTVEMPDTIIRFDTNGKYVSGGNNLNLTLTNGATASQTTVIDVKGVTQYAGSSTIAGDTDGYTDGTLTSISVDSSGVITGSYSNGMNKAEAQVAIAQFANSAGLTKAGTSLYQVSNNSGEPNVKTAVALGVTITPSALEMSNVDLANEFSDMIITQRGFQSNSKIITVSDEMLETLINMKR